MERICGDRAVIGEGGACGGFATPEWGLDVAQRVTTVGQLVDWQAGNRAGTVFLVDPETGVSIRFGEFGRGVRALAMQLRAMGLARGQCVPFALDNGIFTVQLLYGVIYGGFIAVPLNVHAGPEALGSILRHCDCRVVFVSRAYRPLLEKAAAHSGRPIAFEAAESGDSVVGDGSGSPSWPALDPEDPALLIYTSGSVDRPKGVVHCHRGILAAATNSVRGHRLEAQDRALVVLPLHHRNAETVTLTPTLLSGGSLVVPAGFNPRRFWDILHAERCTWAALGPTQVLQLTEGDLPESSMLAEIRSRLRFLRSSSGALSPAVQRRFLGRFQLPLLQALGSTEAGNIFTNPLPPAANKVGSVGLPHGLEVRIAGRAGREVPQGVPGEVLVRGAPLMLGYHRDAEATAAAVDDKEGWWRSGDLARQDEDGYYFIVGRSKELIIKGGVNIAPLEIDAVLDAHPAVLEAAALAVPDAVMGEDVWAFVVLRSGAISSERELIAYCESRLGLFKSPTHICFVDSLPKGPSGKLQRIRLSKESPWKERIPSVWEEDGSAGVIAEAEGPPAGTRIAGDIACLWSALTGVPRGEYDRDFFEMGGDSLLAMQCVSRLRRRYSVALSLSDFFLYPTAARLAEVMRNRLSLEGGRGCEPVPAIMSSPGSRRYVLTRAQQGLWVMHQLAPEEPAYNECEAVVLRGELEGCFLEAALQGVMERHEVLRSTIELGLEGAVATVQPEMAVEVRRLDFLRDSGLDPQGEELPDMLREEARRPFDLEMDPGFRATLVQTATREHVLMLMMHHIVSDRFSFGIAWREMAAGYAARRRGETARFSPMPIQFGDYALWKHALAGGVEKRNALRYWRQALAGAPEGIRWPGSAVEGIGGPRRGAKKRFRLEAELADRLRCASRRRSSTLYCFFAAAFSTLLQRVSGDDEVVLGVPVADRESAELLPLIGYLVDTHALRIDHRGQPPFWEVVRRVRAGIAELAKHRQVSFAEVFQSLGLQRLPLRPPLFQAVLNWRDRDAQLEFIGLEGLTVEPLLVDTGTAKFELSLVLTDTGPGGELRMEFEYRTDLFHEGSIEALAGELREILETAAGPA
ncbi:MAG TPA: condensation domain-containing protein [Verrucomicrobiales bacterium]|nr:condensation domain-containing protein [Verrucomicrobiales bacterium]